MEPNFLRDYLRAALITAAVTGQIYVEAWDKRGDIDHELDRDEELMPLMEARA